MVNDSVASEILNDKDLKVYHWFNQILSDNGFYLHPALWKKGFKYLIFLPATENENYDEAEYKGTQENISRETVTHTKKYDLFSADSEIIEAKLSVEGGNKTREEILAVAEIAKKSENFSTTDNASDVNAVETLNSFFQRWQLTSKIIQLKVLGNINLFIWDNIHVDASHKLFSGTYKIAKLRHKITRKTFTSAMKLVRVSPQFVEFGNTIQ